MAKFEILGPTKVNGEIAVSGAKNAAMKMIAACVLICDEVILENVPDITDIQTIVNILTESGAQIARNGSTLFINTENINNYELDQKLVKKMRGSIVLVGPYLSRFKKVKIAHPGGCVIGTRPVDAHVEAFQQLGTKTYFDDTYYHFERENASGGHVKLKVPSVTATENIIMAQVLSPGDTIIENVAKEPEVVDLINFLNSAGAKIEGAGTSTIKINGVNKLHGLNYSVMPDRIEVGTFIALAIVTKSQLKITNCQPEYLSNFLDIIHQMGVEFEQGKDFIYINNSGSLKAIDVTTGFYPDFPTDLQAPMGLIMTQANGKSNINETVWENRLGYLEELLKMGARVEVINNHQAEIYGPTPLRGARIESLDLRAGATMVLAGLIADGKTIIENAQIIDRGYENIEQRLQKIGVKIKRID